MRSSFVRKVYHRAVSNPYNTVLAIRMIFWVGLVTGLMKFQTLPQVMNFVSPRKSRKIVEQKSEVLVSLLDQLLTLNFLFLTPICWKRSIVLHRFFALNGVKTRVVFGVNKEGAKINGHAWLEIDNKPVFEKQPPQYTVTFTFPVKSR